MKKILAMTAMLALCLILLASCGGEPVNLVGTEWTGSLYGVETTLSFTETDYSLTAGETVLGSGPYTLNGTTITWMSGTDDAAQAGLSVQNVNGVRVLTVSNGDGTTMSYTQK